MKIERRKTIAAGWILLPVILAAALLAAGLAALAAAWWIERRLRSVVDAIALIASGDRYAALPERIGSGAMTEIAAAAERMRQSLIDADALAVGQRSREAEAKLHLAGRAFF